MVNAHFRRIQVSALSLIAFLGLVCHVTIFNSGFLLSIALGANMVDKTTKMLAPLGGSPGAMELMIIVFFILGILPALIPLLGESMPLRWTTFALIALLTCLNAVDGFTHTFIEGEIAQGMATLIISTGAGIAAAICALKWARERAQAD